MRPVKKRVLKCLQYFSFFLFIVNIKRTPPCTFGIFMEICGASVTVNDAQTLLAGKKTKVKKCVSKAGKDFQAAFKLEKDKVVFEFPEVKKMRYKKG